MNFNKKIVSILILVLLSVTVLTGCNETSFEGSKNFAEAKEVKEVYLNESAETIIIDARGAEAYSKGHLKNAIEISPNALASNEPVKAMIASKEQVEKVLSGKGITNDSMIYVYDNGGVSSSRVWWVLTAYGHENVKIINNGATALENQGLEMSLDIPELEASKYVAKALNTNLIATIEEVKAYSDNPVDENAFLLDVRSLAEFEEGFINGATFYPHTKNYYVDGTFKSARDIGLYYGDVGIDKDDAIIAYCKSSYRATVTAALLDEAGFTNVKVYDGAWLQWQGSGETAAVIEESAPITSQDGS